jgi:hypothetical protein
VITRDDRTRANDRISADRHVRQDDRVEAAEYTRTDYGAVSVCAQAFADPRWTFILLSRFFGLLMN